MRYLKPNSIKTANLILYIFNKIIFIIFFLKGYLTWSVSIVELMSLVNAKAFQVLMHLCNSIQFVLDSTKMPDSEISTETRKKLEVIH